MAFIDIAIGAASIFGGDIIGSYLGADLLAGTVLGGASAGIGDAFAGAAGEGFLDSAGGSLAGAAGDGGAVGSEAFNLGNDAAYEGFNLPNDAAGPNFDPNNINSGPYAPPSNASQPGYGPSSDGGAFPGGNNGLSSMLGKAINPMLGTLGSGIIGANGARNAAQTQANAADKTIAMQQGMFDSSQANLQPYINGGSRAMGQLSSKLADGSLGGTFTGADYLANKDPGYQFQLDQGNQALQNSQAAKDGVLGGSALKGLIDYNQGVASTGYQSAYNRWLQSQQNTFGQLSGAAGIGANAAGAGAGNASRFSNSMGDVMLSKGNSQAAGQVGVANNYGKTVGGLGNQLYALSDMAKPSDQSGKAFDLGFNGQNNPVNQSALDDFTKSF